MVKLPAPWGEIEIPSVFIMTVRKDELEQVQDVEALAKFYEKIFKHFVDIMGTTRIHNHERMTFDKQIIGGGCFGSKFIYNKLY